MNIKETKNGFIITGTPEQIDLFEHKFKLYQFCERTIPPIQW
jgi:hypothetical protein